MPGRAHVGDDDAGVSQPSGGAVPPRPGHGVDGDAGRLRSLFAAEADIGIVFDGGRRVGAS